VELGQCPFVVAAERQQAAELGEGAGAERTAKRVAFDEGGAQLGGIIFGVAGRSLKQILFGLPAEIALQLPITAKARAKLGAKALGERRDFLAAGRIRP